MVDRKFSPKELDAQSPVKIDRWLDIDSSEAKELDDNREFTKRILRYGFEDNWLYVDSLGRVFGRPSKEGEPHYPLHFEHGKKLIGYRISKKAAN